MAEVAVQTERNEVLTETTEDQYTPVRLEQARLKRIPQFKLPHIDQEFFLYQIQVSNLFYGNGWTKLNFFSISAPTSPDSRGFAKNKIKIDFNGYHNYIWT